MLLASTIDDRMVGQVFSIGSDQQRLIFLRKLQGKQDIFLSLVWRHLSGSPEAVRTALDLVLRRKALGAEALAAQRDAILGGRYPHLREAFEQLIQLRQRTAQKLLAGAALGEALEIHQQTLRKWQEEQQQRETALARQVPEMSLEYQRQKADRRAVALGLPEGVALIEFVRFDVFDFHAVPARGERKWKPARYLAFVLPAGNPDEVQMIDLGEAEPIDRMIADFRAGLTGDSETRGMMPGAGSPRPVDSPGIALRQAVFDPLRPALGERTRLLLCPDGDLSRLPFEVLPAEGDRYLIDDFRISYLSSGRDVLRFGAPFTRQPADPVVAADPDFDDASGEEPVETIPVHPGGTHRYSPDLKRDLNLAMGANPLPATRIEGERIATRLGVEPWLGSAVLAVRFQTAPDAHVEPVRSPRILHLATHGFFLQDQPHDRETLGLETLNRGGNHRLLGLRLENPMLRSGLLLAGFNGWLAGRPLPPAAGNGMLTAEDITGLDLLDTDLVVLSACETGLGQVHVGEGVFGLRRAFVVAGARTLVMSLWKVPDLATAILMDRFYENLLDRQLPRDEALRQAQLYTRDITIGQIRDTWLTPEMIERLAAGDFEEECKYYQWLEQADDYRPFQAPEYWGAFICQGETAPLRSLNIPATQEPPATNE